MTTYTVAHVTHEACEKIGGIGSVLEGFITSPVYQKHVGRTVLAEQFQLPMHTAIIMTNSRGRSGGR